VTIESIMLLAGAGLLAGVVNALAGGGTIFTFSALMATGLPAITANATSALSVLPGQIAAALAYRREIAAARRRLMPLAAVSALGGLAGGALLLATAEGAFRALVPWLILVATMLFALTPCIAALGERLAATGARRSRAVAIGAQGAVAVYGGYFGAGTGIMMLASLALSEGRAFHSLNAAKNVLACVMQGVAVCVFLANGATDFRAAAVVTAASIAGGWIGAGAGRLAPQRLIRGCVIIIGLAIAAWYFAQ
jgi:uncharacterized protein